MDVVIGEDDNDPVFCVTDLLIHLSREQQTKPASTVVEGENLDLLIGSQPLEGTEKDAVKAMTLKLLNDKYGIEEEDFLSAELEIVPAGKARELGMDASMILAYGQDDRVCAYTSLVAMLEVEAPEKTSCCLLVDKDDLQCFADRAYTFHGRIEQLGMHIDHSTFFHRTGQLIRIISEFYAVLFDDIAGSADGSRAIVAMFGNMISGSATMKQAQVEMLKVFFPSPPVPTISIGV